VSGLIGLLFKESRVATLQLHLFSSCFSYTRAAKLYKSKPSVSDQSCNNTQGTTNLFGCRAVKEKAKIKGKKRKTLMADVEGKKGNKIIA
jgi:hypothetical protein